MGQTGNINGNNFEALHTEIRVLRQDHQKLAPILEGINTSIKAQIESNNQFRILFRETIPVATHYRNLAAIIIFVSLLEGIQWTFKELLPLLTKFYAN